jgi:hypothetical protein
MTMAGTVDDPYERPPGPRPSEIRAAWARECAVENLWDVLISTPWDRIDREAVFELVVQALEVRSRSDPEEFARAAYSRMTVFTSAILMRCHLYLSTYVEQSGRAVRMRGQPPGDLPEPAVETLIPRLVQLQEHLAALLISQSSVARQWSLVRRNRAGHDQVEGTRPGKVRGEGRPGRKPGLRPAGRANGKADHRHTTPLNRRGAHANGVRHDD